MGAPQIDTRNAVYLRSVPSRMHLRTLFSVIGLLFAFMVIMELKARNDNFPLNYPFSADMWVRQWLKLDDISDEQVVVIGASRSQFGVIVKEWEQQTAVKPILLPWPGQAPHPVLFELADRESFQGTVICSIAPTVSFVSKTVPWADWIRDNIKASQTAKWSLSYHLSMAAMEFLRPRFKCLNDAAYSPVAYGFFNFPIANRENLLAPVIFGFNATRDADIQMRYLDRVENGDNQAQLLTNRSSVFRRLKFFGAADVQELVGEYKAAIEKIESRGGKVVFIRPPSDGFFRDYERQHYPRKAYFDLLVTETQCTAVHFEDHDELKDFICVDESHLSKADALKYTRRLINILRQKGELTVAPPSGGDDD